MAVGQVVVVVVVGLRERTQVVKVVHCLEKAKRRLEKCQVLVMGPGIVVNPAKQVVS